MDKILIVLSATSSGLCIILSASVVETPVGIASASFTLNFSLTTGIIKKLLSITRNQNKKEKELYEKKEKENMRMKENVRNVSKRSSAIKQENMRLNSANSRKIKSF